MFGAGQYEEAEQAFRQETVGLVTRDQFMNKQNEIEERFQEKKAEEQKKADEELARKRKLRKVEQKQQRKKMSFYEEDDEEDGDEGEEGGGEGGEGGARKKIIKFATLAKNPHVDTSFLPDKDKEREAEREAEREHKEWLQAEEQRKQQDLKITYSYWDGMGHRRSLTVKQGDTVETFLKKVREQLMQQFRSVRTADVTNLMYVKEDLILPHKVTFHELISSKARGKSGPLFRFDVHDDVRVVMDATKEKEDSHPGKVVQKHWYKNNKHIFPASRWEEYDPLVHRDKYTVHDRLRNN